jgi:hypothetical protein
MPGQRAPRFTGGFGGFLPPPDLPPLGDYEAPTVPVPSLTIYPGGSRQPSTYNTPRSPNNPSGGGGAGYESVSRTLFADDSYRPRTYSPGREPPLPTDSSPPDTVSITTPDPPPLGPTVDVSGRGGGLPSPYWNQPGGGYAQPGLDIAGFGGNMTIGQFLNTPLAMMGFGTNRYQPGNTPNIQSADQIQIGTTSPTGPTGLQMWDGTQWVDAQPSNSNVVPPPDRTDPAFTDPITGTATGGSGGGSGQGPTAHSSDYIGYGPSAMSLADLKIMESQSYGGNPNQVDTSDEGASRFYPAQHQTFLRGGPPVFTNAASVDAYNAWVMSHNSSSQPANPNNLYVQATKSPVRPRPTMTPRK